MNLPVVLPVAVLILMFAWLFGPLIWEAIESRIWQWNIPEPKPGQVWLSERNGDRIMVTDVEMHATGAVFWSWTFQVADGRWNGIGMSECGLRTWRLMVRNERRVLVTP